MKAVQPLKSLPIIIGLIIVFSCKEKEEDILPPSISILSPVTDTEFDENDTVFIRMNAYDKGGLDRIELLIDGKPEATFTQLPYEYPYLCKGKSGQHSLKGFAFDKNENRGESELILIEIFKDSDNETGTVTDIEGNIYKTVTIGNQTWMAENLKTTKFNDGTDIPKVTDNSWTGLTSPAFCWYNNNAAAYENLYGALYNWYTVNTGKLCPTGWHVPTEEDWKILIDYLGGDSLAGGKMKETGSSHWNSPNTGATNLSGYTGMPGGYRGSSDGIFYYLDISGYWWSSTEKNTDFSWSRSLSNSNSFANKKEYNKRYGFSVRCIKD